MRRGCRLLVAATAAAAALAILMVPASAASTGKQNSEAAAASSTSTTGWRGGSGGWGGGGGSWGGSDRWSGSGGDRWSGGGSDRWGGGGVWRGDRNTGLREFGCYCNGVWFNTCPKGCWNGGDRWNRKLRQDEDGASGFAELPVSRVAAAADDSLLPEPGAQVLQSAFHGLTLEVAETVNRGSAEYAYGLMVLLAASCCCLVGLLLLTIRLMERTQPSGEAGAAAAAWSPAASSPTGRARDIRKTLLQFELL